MGQDVVYSLSLFPSGIIPADCDSIFFKCLVPTGTHILKGDNIVLFSFYRKGLSPLLNKVLINTYTLTSGIDGYVYHPHGGSTWQTQEGKTLLSIYSLFDDIVSKYETSFSIEEDVFSGERILRWNKVAGKGFVSNGKNLFNGFWINGSILLSFGVNNGQPVLSVLYDRKQISIRKRDIITFKFEDKAFLSFPIAGNPVKVEGTYQNQSCILPLSNTDIATFTNNCWEMFKIEHPNGDAPSILKNEYRSDYCYPFSSVLFKHYANEFLVALNELSIVPKIDSVPALENKDSIELVEEESCYVYLMVDTTNGFHKIGISNHPEYREKTLQSEKPTIEMICAKKYPSRQIATAIESALHAIFAAKRIRGEWFNLSNIEVLQVVETLK